MGRFACTITWALALLAACKGEQGDPGEMGDRGPAGEAKDGVNCWDQDTNGECNGGEDVNDSGECDVDDCLGPRGPAGTVGPVGPSGPDGPVGPAGPAGLQGIAGLQGPRGPRGAQGAQGQQGLQGIPGIAGIQGVAGAAGPRSTMIAEYEFDEDPGAVEFIDGSGQGNKVTASAGVLNSGSATAHAGKSINFTGVEGVQATSGNLLLDSAQIWPEMWIRTNLPAGTYTLLEKTGSYRLRMTGGQLQWTVFVTGGQSCVINHPGPIPSDTWTHVSGLFDGLTAAVEIDGITRSVPCRTGRLAPSSGATLAIGGKFAGGWSEVFRGNIDEVRIQSTANFTVGKVAGNCGVGQAVTGIGVDGTLTCGAATPQRVIRYNAFDTHLESCCWVADNRSDMFGGVAPSTWTDGNGQANQMSPNSEVLRTLFNKKLYPGINAIINAERWPDNNSTNGRVTVAMARIRNSTQSSIDWTPFFYYTAYASWSERASVSLNGQNVWNSAGSNNYWNQTVNPTMSIPGNQTSTVIWVVPSSPPWQSSGWFRTTFLAFYNDSLNLPNGLSFVDDLETVQGNLW